MKKKKFYKESGQMDLSDRIAIETGLSLGESFTVIGKRLGRHPSTISHEVKENRTYIPSTYPGGKDCWNARKCTAKCICGCGPKVCHYLCKYCKGLDCRTICKSYRSIACHKPESPPYVCNTCPNKKICIKDKYLYSAKYADAAVSRRRSESRQGIRITPEQKAYLRTLKTTRK